MPTPALLLDADSKNDRWQPSLQFISVLDPLGDTIRSEGFESREEVVNILTEAVMVYVLHWTLGTF